MEPINQKNSGSTTVNMREKPIKKTKKKRKKEKGKRNLQQNKEKHRERTRGENKTTG